MICTKCGVLWPYRSTAKACMTCGGKLRLTADDLLGDSPARIVSEIRAPQVEFAKVLDRGIREDKHVTAEAGTGTGKSFSLLIPAILSGKKTVVSTATTLLQSQYIEKDLPFLEEKLSPYDIQFSYALAKGKSHYLCHLALDKEKKKGLKVPSEFAAWAKDTTFGDKKELGENVPDWFWRVCAEDCPGPKYCKGAKNCGYAGAKALLAKADILVANHSLVGINTRLQHRFLPAYDLLILDEAHKAGEYFRGAFASSLGERRASNLVNDIDQTDIFDKTGVRETMKHYGGSFFWDDQIAGSARAALTDLDTLNKQLFGKFKPEANRAQLPFTADVVEGLASDMRECIAKVNEHLLGLASFSHDASRKGLRAAFFACAAEHAAHPAAVTFVQKLDRLGDVLRDLSHDEEDDPFVRYVEFPYNPKQKRKLVAEPIELAPRLQRMLFPVRQVLATSATLTINNSFSFFHRELGFDPKETVTYEAISPFDYANRSVIYLTKRVPVHPFRNKSLNKNDPVAFKKAMDEYTGAMVEEIVELLLASEGHALVLFSSRKEMENTVGPVREELGNKFPIMEQKENLATSVLEEWFRNTSNAVLFGLKSFFEGVDFQGDQLRMVIITKAPFPHQDDLIHKAQRERLEAELGGGYQAFLALDVPKMVSDVRQAAGRLIRTMQDYGCVAILDRTLANGAYTGNKYPRQLGKSLPFTRVVRTMKEVQQFLLRFK